jgi:hypothetical protein
MNLHDPTMIEANTHARRLNSFFLGGGGVYINNNTETAVGEFWKALLGFKRYFNRLSTKYPVSVVVHGVSRA